jgi:hypothetical protein
MQDAAPATENPRHVAGRQAADYLALPFVPSRQKCWLAAAIEN